MNIMSNNSYMVKGPALFQNPACRRASHARTNFLNLFNMICPVQSPLAKIFRLTRRANQKYNSRRLILAERGVGHRHERWGGMRWTQRRRARDRSQGGFPVSEASAPDERR